MISGAIISTMTREILCTLSTINDVASVWGFGSFFRGDEGAKDIDLLAVVKRGNLNLEAIRTIRKQFNQVGNKFGLNVDLTILTCSEFAEKPLREMDELVLLFDWKPATRNSGLR
jgi:predicted nucleotidyltransferase